MRERFGNWLPRRIALSKRMKKKLITITTLAIAALFLLSACSAGTVTISLSATPWMNNGIDLAGNPEYDKQEITEYRASINPNYIYNSFDAQKPRMSDDTAGVQTSTIMWKSGAQSKFLIQTELTVTGAYITADEKMNQPFTSTIKAEVSFRSVSEGSFAPYASTRIFNVAVAYADNEAADGSGYSLKNVNYREKITYDTDANIVTTEMNLFDEATGDYTAPMPIMITTNEEVQSRPSPVVIKKLKKKGNFVDVNQMYYFVRGMSDTGYKTFSASINILNPALSMGEFQSVTVSCNASKDDSVEKDVTVKLADGSEVTKATKRVYFALNSGKTSGKAITAYYSSLEETDSSMKKLLIRIEQEQMLYELIRVNNEPLQGDPVVEES